MTRFVKGWLGVAATTATLALGAGQAWAQAKELVFGFQCDRTGPTANVGAALCPGYQDYIALVNKCRLGVIVPKEHAIRARLRLLEFNQRWLFYYQVYSYDVEGNLKKIGRPFDDGRPSIIGTMPGYV